MNRKTRVRGAVWGVVLASLIFFVMGFWFLTKSSVSQSFVDKWNPEAGRVPHIWIEDVPGYFGIGLGILTLLLIPIVVKAAHKAADKQDEATEMREMLADYRRRKKHIP